MKLKTFLMAAVTGLATAAVVIIIAEAVVPHPEPHVQRMTLDPITITAEPPVTQRAAVEISQ